MRFDLKICEQCCDEIEEYGEAALDHYLWLCQYYKNGQKIMINGGWRGEGNTLTRFLELKGYAVTTEEEGGFLKVKPLGFSEYSDIICAKEEEHEECDEQVW
jgi:hypothetical protein